MFNTRSDNCRIKKAHNQLQKVGKIDNEFVRAKLQHKRSSVCLWFAQDKGSINQLVVPPPPPRVEAVTPVYPAPRHPH